MVFTFNELEDGKSGENSIPPFFQSLVVDEPKGKPYLRIRLEATWEKSNNTEGAIESKIYYITCPEKEEIREENKTKADRRDLDRIRVIYVPAVRDPSKQLKNVSGTMMYQIMNNINWSDITKINIKGKIDELNAQFLEEERDGSHLWRGSLAAWRYSGESCHGGGIPDGEKHLLIQADGYEIVGREDGFIMKDMKEGL